MARNIYAYYGHAFNVAIVLKTKRIGDQALTLDMRNGGIVNLWHCDDGQEFSDVNGVLFSFPDDSEKTITIYANVEDIKDILWDLEAESTFIDLSRANYCELIDLRNVANSNFTNLVMPTNTDTLNAFYLDGINII